MLPEKQGLYSPDFEHDNCGAGFICSLEGKKTNDIIGKALDILVKLEHRGAVSAVMVKQVMEQVSSLKFHTIS